MEAEARPDLGHEVVKEQSDPTRPTVRGLSRAEAPALVPSKPPLRDEEGLVEVGWEGDLDDEVSAVEPPPGDPVRFASHDSPLYEELIEDHYAALQALSERTRSEARLTTNAPGADTRETSAEIPAGSSVAPEQSPDGRSSAAAAAGPGGIRAEGQHELAALTASSSPDSVNRSRLDRTGCASPIDAGMSQGPGGQKTGRNN